MTWNGCDQLRSEEPAHSPTLITSPPLLFSSPVMFTVKASYKHETRKFSFDSDSFPSYTQLHEQVRSCSVPSLFLVLISSPPSSLGSSLLLIPQSFLVCSSPRIPRPLGPSSSPSGSPTLMNLSVARPPIATKPGPVLRCGLLS